MKKYVVVFDICSSTTILEDVIRTGSESHLVKFYKHIYDYVIKMHPTTEVYKFLGDGFILIYNESDDINSIIESLLQLINFINIEITNFIDSYIEDEDIFRVGVTVGIDKQCLVNLMIGNNTEYLSRAINMAARMQSSLKDKEDVNKIMISKSVYSDVTKTYLKSILVRKKRTFRNITGDKELTVYELKNDNKNNYTDKNIFRLYQDKNSKYRFTLEVNGKTLLTSEGFDTIFECKKAIKLLKNNNNQ